MTETVDIDLPEALMERLQDAKRVFVVTGAGMSAESGIPTFRDAQTGIWANFKPEELATPEAFSRNPARVWSWYKERRSRVREARPHAGHYALVDLANRVPHLTIATQNVDGLHQQAGSQAVIELHGNIMRSVCSVTGRVIDDEWLSNSGDEPPTSPYVAEGLARPDVVWFGEPLPAAAIEQSIEAAAICDLCLSIGTTSVVQPAASLPLIALEHGASLVEINPAATPLSLHATYQLRGNAGPVLKEIMNQLT